MYIRTIIKCDTANSCIHDSTNNFVKCWCGIYISQLRSYIILPHVYMYNNVNYIANYNYICLPVHLLAISLQLQFIHNYCSTWTNKDIHLQVYFVVIKLPYHVSITVNKHLKPCRPGPMNWHTMILAIASWL